MKDIDATLDGCKAFLAACDIATVTTRMFDTALKMNPYERRALLDEAGTSFNRLKQEEIRHRIKQYMETEPVSTPDLVAAVGVSQPTIYKHFSAIYKATPGKFFKALHRGTHGTV